MIALRKGGEWGGMDMDGVRERKKHIGRDVERMREVYLERDRDM